MIGTEILDALLEAGASAEMIVAAVKAAASAEETKRGARRAKDAARQRRVRATRDDRVESRVTPRDRADTSPNEINSNPLPPRSSEEDLAPLAERLVAAWNEGPGKAGAVPCRGLNRGRIGALRTRLREHGEAALFEAVRALAASDFHCGRNQRGWKATLGWLLSNAPAFARMLELGAEAESRRGTMSPTEQLASIERSAATLERMGRTEEAAEMRGTAEKLRQQLKPGDE